MSSPPTKSAPAASASFTFSPAAITRTFFDFPRPCGSTTVPRTIWSACLGSTPNRMVTSTVSSNFANFTFCNRGTASCSGYGRASTAFLALTTFFPAFLMCFPRLPPLITVPTSRSNLDNPEPCGDSRPRLSGGAKLRKSSHYINSHRPCRPLHAPDRRIHRSCIQIRHLLLGDVLHLLQRDLADFIF